MSLLLNPFDAEYHRVLHLIKEHGNIRDDRTGTGTISLFGEPQMVFDLSLGFPLITTKKMFTKGAIHELLWFIDGDTNVKKLQENGVRFWDSWADENGDLGPLYGKQLRRIEYSYWVEPKTYEPEESAIVAPYDKEVTIVRRDGDSKFIGATFDTEYGACTVVEEIKVPSGRSNFRIKFHETGSERIVDYGRVQNKKIKDLWAVSVHGVGVYGDCDKDDPDYEMLVSIWRDMLKRCYDESSKAYPSYGAKGVHVDSRWLVFANFQKDAKKLTNWPIKKEYPDDYTLDKDIKYASNRYSKETCMWASHEEQSLNTGTNTPFIAVDPDGVPHTFKSFGQANRDFGLNVSAIHRCLNGKLKSHHGWTGFTYLKPKGLVMRTVVIDQLKLAMATIKHDPNSRRNVISFWNPHEIHLMNLPPCHGTVIQFYVDGDKLHCKMYQRSADMFLGVPVNIASYAMLTMMLAQVCGLKPGKFIHTFGDAHIYLNHLEQIDLQLSRESRPIPRLILNPEVKDIFSFKPEDFTLEGYDPHPGIKGEVAV